MKITKIMTMKSDNGAENKTDDDNEKDNEN